MDGEGGRETEEFGGGPADRFCISNKQRWAKRRRRRLRLWRPSRQAGRQAVRQAGRRAGRQAVMQAGRQVGVQVGQAGWLADMHGGMQAGTQAGGGIKV